jgi:DNA-binding MarR family transcriptional regulator
VPLFCQHCLQPHCRKLAAECWAPVGLIPSRGYLLTIAREDPGVQPRFLVAQLQLTPSTITRLIEKWTKKSW